MSEDASHHGTSLPPYLLEGFQGHGINACESELESKDMGLISMLATYKLNIVDSSVMCHQVMHSV